ncbi:hypothetical protein T4B_10036 [Trichinella pseudospiralis]|uniref:PiggyBac transposable element-derived protein domain-containing protein n=1 Tax=Trichinella pseudospiralis TaxID=6337 RepID=A0A0V1EJ21_TRIPS|nr:hypothetical protein T4A_2237 [Trichinella pseudospiralis]KRZ25170.1 hypothetical protein T4B_10036 [Trichinella pseudospiralis]KRZ40122.1 hypothetical protein T4C_8519 [Trichinella pseudospiralis]
MRKSMVRLIDQRNCTVENFYKSIPLAENLLARKTKIVGTEEQEQEENCQQNKTRPRPSCTGVHMQATHPTVADGALVQYD